MQQYDVALIGIGTMGSGIAANLLKAGYRVVGYNRSAERLASLSAQGLRPAASPAEAARAAGCVLTSVADDAALEAVAFGEQGLLAGLRPGSIFIDCGTTGRALSRRLSAAALDARAQFLEAPVTGSKLGAENGTLTLMVSGPGDALATVQPLLAAISRRIVHVGVEIGLAQAAKLCLNLSQAITLQGTLEAFGLAERLGVPLEKLLELFEHSAARSGVQSFKLPYLLRNDYSPHFRLALMQKDLRLALDESSSRGIELPMASAVGSVFEQACAAGLGEKDFLAVAELLKRSLGVTFES